MIYADLGTWEYHYFIFLDEALGPEETELYGLTTNTVILVCF